MKQLHVRSVFFLVVTLAAVAFLTYAHEDEPHDSSHAGTAPPAEMRADSANANSWDSVYAEIQQGYLKIKPILEQGCYDCHSTQTDYPWYYKLPLIKGMIDSDIRKARKHLDFTDGFPFKGHANPADNLLGIRDELDEGEMPPFMYRMMHWSAKPSDAERDSVFTWIDRSLRLLAAHGQYPFGRKDLVPEVDD
jgi:hypothetical protein